MASWTLEEKELLRERWVSGLSASEIAKKFDDKFTRNAIIGQAHRMNLPEKSRHNKFVIKKVAPPVKPVKKNTKIPYNEPASLHVSMFDVKHNQCRYPHGDLREATFGLCGHPVLQQSSYCPYHFNICRQRKTK